MPRAPLSRPAIYAMVAGFISGVSWGAIAWGLGEPGVLTMTEPTPSGIAIGLGLVPAIIAPGMLLVCLYNVRLVRAARRGENVIGRWTVSAAELAEFATNNAARNARGIEYRNEWKPPRRPPADGIEIIFVPNAVVVGSILFPLVTTGFFRFTGVQALAESLPAIEFGVVSTVVSRYSTRRYSNVLRLPVSRPARGQLDGVVDHFRRVSRREVIVSPDFYRSRIKIGLIIASVGSAATALWFWLADRARRNGDQDMENLGEGLAIGSLIIGVAGLVLAAVAWKLRRRQYRG